MLRYVVFKIQNSNFRSRNSIGRLCSRDVNLEKGWSVYDICIGGKTLYFGDIQIPTIFSDIEKLSALSQDSFVSVSGSDRPTYATAAYIAAGLAVLSSVLADKTERISCES